MKSTCSYLRLKVTYFTFEDVGCIEVMGCVKKLSQTVPTVSRNSYCTVLAKSNRKSSTGRSTGMTKVYSRYDPCWDPWMALPYWDEVQVRSQGSCNRILSPEKARLRSGILGSDPSRDPGLLGSAGISIPRDPAGPEIPQDPAIESTAVLLLARKSTR